MAGYKAPLWIAVCVAVAATYAVAHGPRQQVPINPDFPLDAYPHEQGFWKTAKMHQAGRYQGKELLMLVSWSREGSTRNWEGWLINEQGTGWSFRELWSYAHQGGSAGRIDPKQVQASLAKLPASLQPLPKISHLLAVSFQRNGRWQTRAYYRLNAPPELKRLYDKANGHDANGIFVPWRWGVRK